MMKIIILLIIVLTSFTFTLLIFFNTKHNQREAQPSYAVEPSTVFDYIEENPEKTVFEYVKLSREGEFFQLQELITPLPEFFLIYPENNKLDDQQKQDKKNYFVQDEKLMKSFNQIPNRLNYLDVGKLYPRWIQSVNPEIKEMVSQKIKGNDAKVRIKFEISGNKSPDYEVDFLLHKESQRWKIFLIDELYMYESFPY